MRDRYINARLTGWAPCLRCRVGGHFVQQVGAGASVVGLGDVVMALDLGRVAGADDYP